jgi:hypothetical protein
VFGFACKIFGGIALVSAAVWIYVIHGYSFGKGFLESEMDWNRDGQTTLWEIVEAGSYGLQVQKVHGVECRLIFAYKDGMPERNSCPDRQDGQ